MLRLCLQPVWEGLARHRWNEAQLLTLQQHFANMDLLAEFRLRVRGETLVTMNLADQFQALLEGRRSAWGARLGCRLEEWIASGLAFPRRLSRGWLYQDKVWIYRFYERRADVSKALDHANQHQWSAELRRATDPFLLMLVVPRLKEVFHRASPGALYLQTACQEAISRLRPGTLPPCPGSIPGLAGRAGPHLAEAGAGRPARPEGCPAEVSP